MAGSRYSSVFAISCHVRIPFFPSAERRYRAVEPENRLVGRNLETEWERSLVALEDAQRDLERRVRDRPRQLAGAERISILDLGNDLAKRGERPGFSAFARSPVFCGADFRVGNGLVCRDGRQRFVGIPGLVMDRDVNAARKMLLRFQGPGTGLRPQSERVAL